jgi:ABC-type branched-subunit amino acid transport system substrate-binding protein
MTKLPHAAAIGVALALAIALPVNATPIHKNRRARLTTPSQVVVQRGQSVKIAFATDPEVAANLGNAIEMAVEAHPAVRGFPIETKTVNMPCGDTTADLTAATTIASDARYVGVLGPYCSTAAAVSLPLFQDADLVTISGSTTNPSLPPLGPDVFNSLAVSDSCCPFVDQFDPWYTTVTTLPSDQRWGQRYNQEFGTTPAAFADLYYDAASLLIRDLQETSTIDSSGNLIIDRARLAQAIRTTTNYHGVTCTITLNPDTGYRVNDPTTLTRCTD